MNIDSQYRIQSRTRGRRRFTRDAGMTLLEVLIVLALISLIAGSVGVMVFQRFKTGQVKVAKTQVSEVVGAVQQFMLDNNNNCPTGLEQLAQQKLVKKNTKDPWGKEIIVRCPGTKDPDSADVVSTGPDKTEGTDDDVNSWDL